MYGSFMTRFIVEKGLPAKRGTNEKLFCLEVALFYCTANFPKLPTRDVPSLGSEIPVSRDRLNIVSTPNL
jgi:hypothetical protein